MAWIESHQTLPDHPKTRKAATLLKTSVPAVIGHLHMLWYWSMDYAQDGDLTPFSAADLALVSGWTKDPQTFVDALVDCGLGPGRSGFLDRDESGTLRIHDWEQYIGRLLDKRRKDADRKRSVRSASSGQDADAPQVGARTNRTVPTNQPTVPLAAAADGLPVAVRERRDTLLSRLPQKFQRDDLTWSDAELLARDCEDSEAITRVLDDLRREGVLPFPTKVRERLVAIGAIQAHVAPKAPRPKRPDEPMSLDEFRAIAMADGGNS